MPELYTPENPEQRYEEPASPFEHAEVNLPIQTDETPASAQSLLANLEHPDPKEVIQSGESRPIEFSLSDLEQGIVEATRTPGETGLENLARQLYKQKE